MISLSQPVAIKPNDCNDILKFLSAEMHLQKCLPGWIKMASSLKLRSVLQQYLDVVQEHIRTIKLFLSEEEFSSATYQNMIMQAFIEATEKKVSACACDNTKDGCLAKCSEAISYYKKNSYALAATFISGFGKEIKTNALLQAQADENKINNKFLGLTKYLAEQKDISFCTSLSEA